MSQNPTFYEWSKRAYLTAKIPYKGTLIAIYKDCEQHAIITRYRHHSVFIVVLMANIYHMESQKDIIDKLCSWKYRERDRETKGPISSF
jgi:hypothetical protein